MKIAIPTKINHKLLALNAFLGVAIYLSLLFLNSLKSGISYHLLLNLIDFVGTKQYTNSLKMAIAYDTKALNIVPNNKLKTKYNLYIK